MPGPPGQGPGTPDLDFASRGGLKLEHALKYFQIDVRGVVAADMGCSTGGFTDCLLRHGAGKVYAIDTAYGQLAWKLRNDPRVVVMERTNALHAVAPEPVGLVAADMSWTPQRLVVPAGLAWLRVGGRMVSLIKPHYELKARGRALPRGGVLDEERSRAVADEVAEELVGLGARVVGTTRSPILGGGTGRGAKQGKGNVEWLVLLERA